MEGFRKGQLPYPSQHMTPGGEGPVHFAAAGKCMAECPLHVPLDWMRTGRLT